MRRGRGLAALAGLVGALAQPAAATSFGGDPRPGGHRLHLLLQTELGPGVHGRRGLRDLRLDGESFRITGLLLPGEASGAIPALRPAQRFHRRIAGPSLFLPTGPGPAPGVTAIPEPATLALVLAGLLGAGALARRRARH